MSEAQTQEEGSYRDVVRPMKRTGSGCFTLGSDGVIRSFDGSYERNVIDAAGFSPAQIKQFLDKQPWSQATEDKFRGVDGRKVVDHEALFNPPDSDRPPKLTEEGKATAQLEVDELNRKLMERIAQEEKDGVNIAEKYACGRVVSNYDLSPKPKV